MDAGNWSDAWPRTVNRSRKLSHWRPGESLVHAHSSRTNICAIFEAAIKHETPNSIVDPIYTPLLGAIQSLQQQVAVINQQLAGLCVQRYI